MLFQSRSTRTSNVPWACWRTYSDRIWLWLNSRIDVWIYGHSHTNIDTEINGTKVVCNQLGYVQCGEREYGFDGRKFIEV